MMKRMQNILKMTLIMVLTLTTFSGAIAVQAAGPRPHQQWEQRDDRNRNDRPAPPRRDDRHWDKKDNAKDEADSANKKANWALGIAAVAAIIAVAK